MTRIFHPILAYLAGMASTELAAQIVYLKAENETLRRMLPKRIVLDRAVKRRLAKLAVAVKDHLKDIASIAAPKTILRWIREFESTGTKPAVEIKRSAGRPRTKAGIRELIIQMARETGSGYTRILCQLRRLGIKSISRQTVKNILKDNGFEPGPIRGSGSWAEFLKAHAETLWQADFFSVKAWTMRGLVEYFAIAFIHVGSRRVWVTPVTAHPDGNWVAQQARNFAIVEGDAPAHAMIYLDRDTKFTSKFRAILDDSEFRPVLCPIKAPNTKPHVERWIQAVKQECLDAFVICGDKHLNHLIGQYVAYHNNERPHSSLDSQSPNTRGDPFPHQEESRVIRHNRLGGVLNWYECRAA